jgi:hypothetical protein
MNIEDLINDEINQIHKESDQWDAVLCAQHLVALSVYYSNLNRHLADLESAYHKFYKFTLDSFPEQSAAKLKIIIEASDEYERLNKARRLERSLVEIIRSLKRYTKAKENEYSASSNI